MIYNLDAKISKYFSLKDLTRTDTGLPNTPDTESADNLIALAEMLDMAWDLAGSFRVVSGYRSEDVNAMVGGAPGSLHTTGEAVDLQPLTKTPEQFWSEIYGGPLRNDFGEIILKPSQGTIHLSLPTFTKKGRAMILENGIYRSLSSDEISSILGQYGAEAVETIEKNPFKTAALVLTLSSAAAFYIMKRRGKKTLP